MSGGGSKLIAAEVRAIRIRWTSGSHLSRDQRLRDYAREYGVCTRTIERILAYDTYRDVT